MTRLYSLAHLLLVIIALDGQWEVRWTPHEANVSLLVVTQCDGGEKFFAYNRYDVTPEQNQMRVRQVYIHPSSTGCWVGAEIIRNETDDPTQEYRGEWSMTRVDE
jgi:hypothetical protein